MAVNFKGGFKIGGTHYSHPLTSEELQFLLEWLGKTEFTGTEVQAVFNIAFKLQEEYKQVKKLEKTKK